MALSRDLGTNDTSYMTLVGRFEAIKKEAQSLSAINVNVMLINFACNVPFPLIIFAGTNALLSKRPEISWNTNELGEIISAG